MTFCSGFSEICPASTILMEFLRQSFLRSSEVTARLTFWTLLPTRTDLTTPHTDPNTLHTGPPEFPGCTGTDIWKTDLSGESLAMALRLPLVNFTLVPSTSVSGNPTTNKSAPKE